MELEPRVAFAVGTGRCGTLFLTQLMQLEDGVAASHEREPNNATFHRYCKWYGIAVDPAGFLHQKRKEVEGDLADHCVSFEASAFLSLSLVELQREFDARFVFLVRHPYNTIASYLRKGWYEEVIRQDPALPPTYQPSRHFHHFLGRILPNGNDFEPWSRLTRAGRLAWYWRALNEAVMDLSRLLPSDSLQLVRLEDLDYDRYRALSEFICGRPSTVSRALFESIAISRPNALRSGDDNLDFSDQEWQEIREMLSDSPARFGYDLAAPVPSSPLATRLAAAAAPVTAAREISPSDLFVIVRSAGERTRDCCHWLLEQQVRADCIAIVEDQPFSQTLRRSMALGIEKGLPWTLHIDADVLVRPDAIRTFCRSAAEAAADVFEIQALVLCKFFGGPRPAGNHLYRTRYLPELLACIPSEETLRPETSMIRHFASKGHRWLQTEDVIGLHDFEQHSRDIVLKCILQAHKHQHYIFSLFKPFWSRHTQSDADYRAALLGLMVGLTLEDVRVDRRLLDDYPQRLLALENIVPKPALAPDAYPPNEISRIMAGWEPPPEYAEVFVPQLKPSHGAVPAGLLASLWNMTPVRRVRRRIGQLLTA